MRIQLLGTILLSAVALICAADEKGGFWSKITSFFSRQEKKKAENSPIAMSKIKLHEGTIQTLLADAQVHIDGGNYTGAIEFLLQVLENTADHQRANALLGTSFLALERSDLAESFLYTAVRMSNYSDIASISNLAESLRLNGDVELAIEVLQRNMPKQRGNSSGILEFEMGEVLSTKKDFTSASDWFLASALLNPRREEAWLRASTLQFPSTEQNYTIAESVLTQALAAIPSSTELAFNLATVLHASNRMEHAVVLYDEVLRLNPTFPGAASNLATALHGLGRLDDAGPVYAQAMDATPSNAVLLCNYAIYLHTMKRYQSSYDILNKALSIEPISEDSLDTKNALLPLLEKELNGIRNCKNNAVGFVQQASWDEVINTLISCGEPVENAAWWFATAGITQHMRGQYRNSFDLCQKADSLLPSPSHVVYGCLGVASQYSNEYAEAVRYFRTSQELLRMESYSDPLPFIGMSMTAYDVEYNLLQAMNVNQEFDACTEEGLDMLGLPKPVLGGATVLAFSFVDWSADKVAEVNRYGEAETSAGRLLLPKGKYLHDEVKRVQHSATLLLTTILSCMSHASAEPTLASRTNALAAMSRIAGSDARTVDSNVSAVDEKLVLVTQFFIPTGEDAEKVRGSVQDALARNLVNDAISDVILINEVEYDFSGLVNHDKIIQFVSGSRLKFSDAFRLINERIPAGKRVVVANADIYFDDSLQIIQHTSKFTPETAVALSKWVSDGATLTLPIRADSQDAWMFQSPVKEDVIALANFFFGMPKCDNRLAKILVDSGYRVINPALSVRAVERDDRARSVLYPPIGAVYGPVAQVLLTDDLSL